jgi:mono/diheme cytochrome c family protein
MLNPIQGKKLISRRLYKMKLTHHFFTTKVVFFFLLFAFLAAVGAKQQLAIASPDDEVKKGGQLYDNWPKISDAKLNGNNPLYPESSKKKGITTWRCKECHGWDYIGKEGRYKGGSHYTGIGGVLSSQQKTIDELQESIGGGQDGHNFGKYLDSSQVQALAKFVKEGAVDMSTAISPEGKMLGDIPNGKKLFTNICSPCHGDDGNNYDFEGDEGVQGVGFLANDNPQETLHKILWGNPKTDMPSLITDEGLSIKEAADILAYSQSLK